MQGTRRILVTGATGKVGRAFVARVLSDPRFQHWSVRALCHERVLEAGPRLEVVRGSMSERADVTRAVEGVTHVLHLATCKELPDRIMDVAVKGFFFLLEACRESSTLEQLVLIGGDAAVGHSTYPRSIPVTESESHRAYPGSYALSKVLEEVMLEQYFIQHDLNGCCLRAPWIMEKDDLKQHLSFARDAFGAPSFRALVGESAADAHAKAGAIPILLDPHGVPVKRNFVHVDDLVSCILLALDNEKATQQLFNVGMDEPVDYGALGAYLQASRGISSVPVKGDLFSVWLDNSKAKLVLDFRPQYDLKRLVDSAFDYVRAPEDPRKIHYPG